MTNGVAVTTFLEDSTAGEANFRTSDGAGIDFADTTSASNAIFVCNGGTVSGRGGGGVGFSTISTAAEGHFTINGAAVVGAVPANASFSESATAGNATFILNGSTVAGAEGGVLYFFEESSAGNASITANGGSSGGEGGNIYFREASNGDTASIALFGNGQMDIRTHVPPGVTIGSVEGDGLVFLGLRSLTIGSNNRSTTFSGLIQESGALAKIGSGTLTLSGANTYTGTTTVSAGVLRVSNAAGSGTGTGAVKVNAGTLGGKGTLAGAVTIGAGSGAGAFLAPSVGASTVAKLTIQSALTFKADGTYTCKLNTRKAKADQVIANGVTIESGAQFAFQPVANQRLRRGMVFSVINNSAATPIAGEFASLPDNSTFASGRNIFQVDYEGGDGNDLTLTVAP